MAIQINFHQLWSINDLRIAINKQNTNSEKVTLPKKGKKIITKEK